MATSKRDLVNRTRPQETIEITFTDLARKVEEVRARADQLLSLGGAVFARVTGSTPRLDRDRERAGTDSDGFLPRALGLLVEADGDLESVRELLNHLHGSLENGRSHTARGPGA